MTHLPVAVHLVAETPQFNIERLFSAVFNSHIGKLTARAVVCIFNNVARAFCAARAEVYGIHNFTACLFCPIVKLVKPHFICLGRLPGKVKSFRALAYRTHRILPIKARHKVAARVSYNGHAEIFNKRKNIFSEALLVCFGVIGLINAAVNGSAEMLNKRTVYSVVNSADSIVPVKYHIRFFHRNPPLCNLFFNSILTKLRKSVKLQG